MQLSRSNFSSAQKCGTMQKTASAHEPWDKADSAQSPNLLRQASTYDVTPKDQPKALPVTSATVNRPSLVILRLKQIQARIALGRSSIYALADKNSRFYDPSFPRRIKISAHAVGWVESEIDAWLLTRIAASRSQ